ncbi:MAG: cyclic nucleotide-binding domain-containing protein [Myxococcota bacterium]|nr:cyclic nucleotide-binding domain-containing protein [Myxococcota bacterium]
MRLPLDTLSGFLSRSSLCAGFTPADIHTLASWLEPLEGAEGDVLFEEGALGAAVYVVLEGHVRIERRMPTGPEHELALLGPGELFGEMSLVDGAPRMATATADTPLLLARLGRPAFESRLENGDPVATRLLRAMAAALCARQRELTWLLQEMVDFKQEGASIDNAVTKMLQRQVTWH